MTAPKRALDPIFVEEFRRQLMDERSRLLRTVATTDEELATLEAHQPGAPSEDVAREEVLAILPRIGGREKHELDEIYAASARLDSGAFGVCEGCGGALPLARLRAMPTARHCVTCQAKREQEARAP